ncbi:MAG TPA: hypothetical protein VFD43_02845, partial [Planctomycetota bacterium]|nr:hypothetical protein [Planctomycetota bacterium]
NLFTHTLVPASVTAAEGPAHDALEAGFAVVWASMTLSRGGETGVPVDGTALDPYGPAYFGNGVFIPPDVELPGYTGPVHPYLDPSRPMPEKDVIMMVQHVKHQARTGGLPVDPERVVVFGSSAAAATLWWIVAAPDRSELWTNPSGQELEDTRVTAAILRGGAVYLPAYVPGPPVTFFHFPRDESATGGAWDVPATHLADVLPAILERSSSLVRALDEGATPGIVSAVHHLPIYVAYDAAPNSYDWDGPPWVQGTEQAYHSAWNGGAWKAWFCHSRFVAMHGAVEVMGPWADALSTELPGTIFADMAQWARAVVDGELQLPWTPLGAGLPGAAGVPVLRACGSLQPGEATSFLVGWAAPGAAGALVLGVAQAGLPFKGGVMVPAPDLILPLLTDADGAWSIGFPWLHGVPHGFSFHAQAWIADAGAPAGFAATPGLRATTP